MSPFYSRLSACCDRQHPRIEIKSDNLAVSTDSPKRLAREHARPAANVQNLVAHPDSSGVGNRRSPSAEDRGYEAGLVDFGSAGRDLPAFGLSHGDYFQLFAEIAPERCIVLFPLTAPSLLVFASR